TSSRSHGPSPPASASPLPWPRRESDPVNIHEYQAKELLAGFGVGAPKGGVAYSADQAVYRAVEIGGSRWVVKAQIHSGARGKAGGVRLCAGDVDVRQAAKELLGKTLVTAQTGPDGLPVHRLLVEEALPIARELYLGLVLDRGRSDRKSTRLNSSHVAISYAVFCLKKKKHCNNQ